MLDVRKINPHIKWFPVATRGRNQALLLIEHIGLADLKGYIRKIHKINYKTEYFRQFDGKRWMSQKDHDIWVELLSKKMEKQPDFLYRFGAKMEKYCGQMFKLVDKYKKVKWMGFSNAKLFSTLEMFADLEAKIWGGTAVYSYYFFFNDIYLIDFQKFLADKLKDKFEKVWHDVITPEKITPIAKERVALLKLADEFIKNKKIDGEKIRKHQEKFAFVKKFYYLAEGFTLAEMKKRLGEIMKMSRQDIKKELLGFRPPDLDLNKFNLSLRDRWIIRGFKKAAYAVNLCDGVSNYYTYFLRPLFNEISKRLGISYDEFVSMRLAEIERSLKQNKLSASRNVLKARFKNHALIFTKGKIYVLSGNDLKRYYKLEPKEKIVNTKELKGMVAFEGGKILGKARIIGSDEKVHFFKEGEILVAPMTNPAYVPAMQKAKAIITDEGGLLCHAAIVAREMKKPCVIGTKIATKVLRDGQLVEVDATNGIVKVVK